MYLPLRMMVEQGHLTELRLTQIVAENFKGSLETGLNRSIHQTDGRDIPPDLSTWTYLWAVWQLSKQAREGDESLFQYCAAIARSQPWDAAFADVFGFTHARFVERVSPPPGR